MENCVTCRAELFSAVHFCPYCRTDFRNGTPVAAVLSTAAPAAEVPVPPAPVVATPPVQAPAPAPSQPAAPAPAPAPAARAEPPPLPRRAPEAVPPVVAGAGRAAPVAPAEPVPPRRSTWRRKLAMVGLGLLGLVAVAVWVAPNRDPGAECASIYETGKGAVTAGDETGARAQLTRANASCGADSAQARDLGTRIDAAFTKAGRAAACRDKLGEITSWLEQGELAAARQGLDALDGACASGSKAKAQRQQLARKEKQAQQAEAAEQARQQAAAAQPEPQPQPADSGAVVPAPRANPDIDRVRSDMKKMGASVGADLPEVPELPGDAMTQPAQRPPAGSASRRPLARESATGAMQAEMAQGFLRDAEQALDQHQFDAARTYIESARRVDPGNRRADALARTVRERERQVLQNETTIR